MKQLIYVVSFLVLTITITSMYGMKGGRFEAGSTLPFPDLPDELWLNIIELASQDGETCQYANENERSIAMLQTIRRVVPLRFVCRRFREIGLMAIDDFLCRTRTGMEQFGGKDVVFGRAVSNEKEEVARLCLGLGSDINAIRYTADTVIAPTLAEKETLLTRAIKERSIDQIKLVLKLGADPMQPNAHGEIPIDLAFDISGRSVARALKENGGDQENRYKYCQDGVFRGVGEYGCEYGLKRLAQQADSSTIGFSPLKCIWRSPWAMFCVGVTVSSVSCWAYRMWQKRKKEQRKKQLQAEWESFQPEIQP